MLSCDSSGEFGHGKQNHEECYRPNLKGQGTVRPAIIYVARGPSAAQNAVQRAHEHHLRSVAQLRGADRAARVDERHGKQAADPDHHRHDVAGFDQPVQQLTTLVRVLSVCGAGEADGGQKRNDVGR